MTINTCSSLCTLQFLRRRHIQ